MNARTFLLLIAVLFLRAPQVFSQMPSTGPPAPPATREVVDETGRTVRVPLLPLRVVSLAPSLTETVYALGLQDRLVGDTDFCDYPAAAQKKTKVGGGINPNIEVIVSLQPDLVLVAKSFNRLETVRALEVLGIPSYSTDPHTVDEIVTSTERLASVLGVADVGKSLTTKMNQKLYALREKLTPFPQTRVLFVVWREPLVSIGKGTFVADALHKAGADSIVDSAHDWPQMNLEEVVHLQPEYLIFAASHSDAGAHDFETLAAKPAWQLLDAVQKRRFAVVSDAIIRPGPRIVSVIEDLARQLHPAAFQESAGTSDGRVSQNSMTPPNTTLDTSLHAFFDDTPSTVDACAR